MQLAHLYYMPIVSVNTDNEHHCIYQYVFTPRYSVRLHSAYLCG